MIKKWFSPHTLKWWQVGILKVYVLAFGILIGAYWPEFFENWTIALLTIFIASGLYLIFFWFKD